MFAGFGAAEDTNARFRQLLDAGQTGLSIAYDMPTLYGYDTDDPEAEGEFGTCGVAVSSLADMEVLLAGLPLDRVSTSMTINSPAAPIWAMYIVAAEKAGVPRGAARGDDPERHPQGVHRPEGVPLPAGALDAPRHRHHRVRDARAAALEHGLDQRLPHPRGGLDRGPGAGVHDRRRDGLRRGRARARPAHRRLRAAPRLLLQLALGLLRGDRQVPGVAPDLASAHDRALRRRERALGLDALPHADRRRLADAAAAAQQPDARRDPGARRRPRRDAVAPHRRPRRGARGARPPRRRCSPSASSRSSPRRPASTPRSTRSAARGSSRRSRPRSERQAWRYIDEIDRRGGMVAAVTEGYPQREIADAAYRYQREFDAGERRVVGRQRVRRRGRGDRRAGAAASRRARWRRQLARLERTRRERDAEAVGGGAGRAARRGLAARDAATRTSCRTSSAARRPTRRSASSARSCARSSGSTASRSRSERAAATGARRTRAGPAWRVQSFRIDS